MHIIIIKVPVWYTIIIYVHTRYSDVIPDKKMSMQNFEYMRNYFQLYLETWN